MDKMWLKNYPVGVPTAIDCDDTTLVDMLELVCEKYSHDNAITCHGVSYDYTKTLHVINNLAASLSRLGVRHGDRVAIVLPNTLQYPLCVFAILKLGAIVVNVNPLYTSPEMEYIFHDSKPKVVIILDMFAEVLNNIVIKCGIEHVIVSKIADAYPIVKRCIFGLVMRYVKGVNPKLNYQYHKLHDMLMVDRVLNYKHKICPSDLAFLQYTGATTGKPKGAMLSHSNIVGNIKQISAWLAPQVNRLNGHVVISALPLYHIFSLTANLFTFFFNGSENVMIPNPKDMKDLVNILKKTPFTVFTSLDTLYNRLLNYEPFVTQKFPTYKYSVAGGMILRDSVAKRWYDVTGVMPSNCYGLTETSPAVTMNTFDGSYDGSVGFPIPSTDVEIRNIETHEPVQQGENGIICVRGPQVMSGYWNNIEKTNQALDDGWFYTGDIGYLDHRGKLYISGRQTELIIVSGFNVYPAEVESVLDAIPEIKEAAVVGSADEVSGEQVNAFIVFNEGKSIDKKHIIDKCHEALTHYKTPRQIFILDELPKTPVGKIAKTELYSKYLNSGMKD